jgi:hypothetical protein
MQFVASDIMVIVVYSSKKILFYLNLSSMTTPLLEGMNKKEKKLHYLSRASKW